MGGVHGFFSFFLLSSLFPFSFFVSFFPSPFLFFSPFFSFRGAAGRQFLVLATPTSGIHSPRRHFRKSRCCTSRASRRHPDSIVACVKNGRIMGLARNQCRTRDAYMDRTRPRNGAGHDRLWIPTYLCSGHRQWYLDANRSFGYGSPGSALTGFTAPSPRFFCCELCPP